MRREHPEYFQSWGGIFSITNEQAAELRKKKRQAKIPALAISVVGSDGDLYTVEPTSGGRWTCTCPGYKFHRNCRHLNNLKQKGS